MIMPISEMSPEAIPALSTMMRTQSVIDKAGTRMLAKTLDTNEQAGKAMVQMMRSSMERSVNPAVGGNIDVSV